MISILLALLVALALGPTAPDDNRTSVVAANNHLVRKIGDYKVSATNTNVRSGRLVKRDDADGKIIVCGDEDPDWIGVVGARIKDGEYSYDADFAEDDVVEVLRGGTLQMLLVDGETVVQGNYLVPAASGKVKLYAPDVTATVDEANVEAALQENASRVGKAAASVTASGADENITVEAI